MTNYPKESVCNDDKLLYRVTLLKSSNQDTNKLYARAYTNACHAVKLDTNAKYKEAKDAYNSVIKVSSHFTLCNRTKERDVLYGIDKYITELF